MQANEVNLEVLERDKWSSWIPEDKIASWLKTLDRSCYRLLLFYSSEESRSWDSYIERRIFSLERGLQPVKLIEPPVDFKSQRTCAYFEYGKLFTKKSFVDCPRTAVTPNFTSIHIFWDLLLDTVHSESLSNTGQKHPSSDLRSKHTIIDCFSSLAFSNNTLSLSIMVCLRIMSSLFLSRENSPSCWAISSE